MRGSFRNGISSASLETLGSTTNSLGLFCLEASAALDDSFGSAARSDVPGALTFVSPIRDVKGEPDRSRKVMGSTPLTPATRGNEG